MALAPPEDPDERVQMNVRVPRSLRDQIDTRRAELEAKTGGKFSRDRWIENAARHALAAKGVTATPAGKTATPPHRRPQR